LQNNLVSQAPYVSEAMFQSLVKDIASIKILKSMRARRSWQNNVGTPRLRRLQNCSFNERHAGLL